MKHNNRMKYRGKYILCIILSACVILYVISGRLELKSNIPLIADIDDVNAELPQDCLNSDFQTKYSISVWTMLSDDSNYIQGAVKLGHSIERHTSINVDLVVMELKQKPLNPSDWSRLITAGWKRCVVNRIRPRDEYNTFPRFRDQFSKLHLWHMTAYKTIVYFDADTLVIGNIDDLINIDLKGQSIGVTRDIRSGEWQNTFNMGVFVIHPNVSEYTRLITLKHDRTFEFEVTMSEQGFLNNVYIHKWFEIGLIYNANLAVYSQRRQDWEQFRDRIRVIHYTMEKPWGCSSTYKEICNIWRGVK